MLNSLQQRLLVTQRKTKSHQIGRRSRDVRHVVGHDHIRVADLFVNTHGVGIDPTGCGERFLRGVLVDKSPILLVRHRNTSNATQLSKCPDQQ